MGSAKTAPLRDQDNQRAAYDGQRRYKGEVRQHEMGCEHDVFKYCLYSEEYHGKFARFDDSSDGSKSNGKGKKRQSMPTVWMQTVLGCGCKEG